MALPTYEKQADIPKGFEELYEEKGGKWEPKPAEDVSGLKRTLDTIKQEKKDEEKARRKAEEERADLERKLAAAGTGEEKDKVAKALAKFDADLAAAKADHEKVVLQLQGELRGLKLTDQLKARFLAAGGRPERADKMLRDTEGRFDLEGDRIVVKDPKGTVTSQTPEDYFAKTYRTEVPEFYTGTKAAGGGGGSGGGSLPAGGGGKMSAEDILANPLAAMQQANESA